MIARIWRRLRGSRQTPARVAIAVASGLFIGCLPIYGLHFVLCALVCLPLGLDLVLSYLVANISNPFVAPFLVGLEIEIGSLLIAGRHAAFTLPQVKQTGFFGIAREAAVGSVLLGLVLALLGGALAWLIAGRKGVPPSSRSDEDFFLQALQRTLARYHQAPIGDRCQVAGKLHWDPLTSLLSELPRGLGRVLDAGAGRGQFGLFLLELGACEKLLGFDADARKVAVAQEAAGEGAHFEVRDFSDFPATPADTVLFFDVLHYLPVAEQDELLSRVSRSAERILIRELDSGPSIRSRVTRFLESLAKLLGLHRARAGHHYRSAREIISRLGELGFECEVRGASAGTPFGNVLIVALRATG